MAKKPFPFKVCEQCCDGGGTGGGGESDVFIVQFNTKNNTADKTYNEILEAVQEHKVVMLYENGQYLASLNNVTDNSIIFETHDLYNILTVEEYICYAYGGWVVRRSDMVTQDYLAWSLSPNNTDFIEAVQSCFPDADEMTFPLENVREVSAE